MLEDGKIKVADLKERIKALRKDKAGADERAILESYVKLVDNEATYNKTIKALREDLDKTVKKHYEKLTEEEIKHLIVDLKWSFAIFAGIDVIYSTVSHHLANRIIELAERYETTLSECASDVDDFEKKVKAHLERMGFAWS